MITNNNQGGGNDQFSAAANDTARVLGSGSANAARAIGDALGAFGIVTGVVLYKFDFYFVGYWRRRIAYLYDRLGCKFLG